MDHTWKEHPITYYSRKLLPRERRYAAIEERNSMCSQAFRISQEFTICTDSQELQSMKNNRLTCLFCSAPVLFFLPILPQFHAYSATLNTYKFNYNLALIACFNIVLQTRVCLSLNELFSKEKTLSDAAEDGCTRTTTLVVSAYNSPTSATALALTSITTLLHTLSYLYCIIVYYTFNDIL